MVNSVETLSVSRENRDLRGSKVDEIDAFGSSNALLVAAERVTSDEGYDRRGIDENSSGSGDGVMLETVIVLNSEQNLSFNGEKRGFGSKIDGKVERIGQFDQGSSGSKLVDDDAVVLETVIVVSSDQRTSVNGESGAKNNELVEALKKRIAANTKKDSCVIDMKCDGEGGKGFKESEEDEERVCRICQLSSEQFLETAATADATTTAALIQLGCKCKGELSIAHSHCAEAWFKQKGSRFCEICGESAKNITGDWDSKFMEEWNEQRLMNSTGSSSERGQGCWRGRPLCNFLMACLIIAFILPWFFRVNMF